MAGTKSKSQTKVSERQVPADSAPTARRARMMRLGTYQLQGPSSDANRLQPVAVIAAKAYEIMNKERDGAAVIVKDGPKVVEMDTAEVDNAMDTPVVDPAPKPPKAPKAPKSESEVKRLAEQKKARAEQSKRDKAKNKAAKEAISTVRPGVTEPLASEVGTEPKK